MVLLLLSIVALLLGPWLYRVWSRGHAITAVVDGFVFVAISGIVVFLIMPVTFAGGGWLALVWIAAGAVGPTLSEHAFRRIGHGAHNLALSLGLLGIGFHGLIDGAALAEGGHRVGAILPLAIILHRFPAGLAIWWLVKPTFGSRTAAAVLGLVIVGTIGGYLGGGVLLGEASLQAVSWFEAFVAGALLHVVAHRPHDHRPSGRTERRLEGLGALAGLLVVAVLVAIEREVQASGRVGDLFLALALESAPALVLAYVMAGLMSTFMPRSSVAWMRRGGTMTQALKGMTFGLPLPICSCGVVPLYRTLVLQGAPMAAAMAFFVATPELGLDAIFLSVPLLGGPMTLIRVVGAIVVALAVGWLVTKLTSTQAPASQPVAIPPVCDPGQGMGSRAWVALSTGFGEVVDHTAPWIILGLVVAALATPLVESGFLGLIPRGLDVLVFAVIGLPIYVCASAATPLVAVMLAGGVSPGAALAFLLTGPATNVTTFGVLSQLHGKRTALTFSLTITGLSVVLGWVVNAAVPEVHGVVLAELSPEGASLLQIGSLVILTGAVLFSLFRRGVRAFLGEITFRTRVPAAGA